MKYRQLCPKCGSRDLVRLLNDGFPDSSTKGIMAGMTVLSNIGVERYICCQCGYTEQWVDPRSIPLLKESRKAKPVNN